MKYLLDTNAVIALFKGDAALVQRLRSHSPEDYVLSSIVLQELYYGAFKSVRVASNLSRIDGLKFAVLDFDRETAGIAGRIRAQLAVKGTPIGPYDALIAAQALHHALAVVTRNCKEFERFEGLMVESW